MILQNKVKLEFNTWGIFLIKKKKEIIKIAHEINLIRNSEYIKHGYATD